LPEPYLRYKEHKEGDEEEEEDDENEDADDGDDEEGIDGGDGGDAKRRKGRRKRRGSNYMADGDDVCSHPLNRNTAFSLDCKDKPRQSEESPLQSLTFTQPSLGSTLRVPLESGQL